MTRQPVRLRHQLALRTEHLKQLAEMIQASQALRQAIQPVMAVLIDKAVQADCPPRRNDPNALAFL